MDEQHSCAGCGVPVPRPGRRGPWPRRCADCNVHAWRRRQEERRKAVPRCRGVTHDGGDCTLAGRFLSLGGLPVCGHHQALHSVLTFGRRPATSPPPPPPVPVPAAARPGVEHIASLRAVEVAGCVFSVPLEAVELLLASSRPPLTPGQRVEVRVAALVADPSTTYLKNGKKTIKYRLRATDVELLR